MVPVAALKGSRAPTSRAAFPPPLSSKPDDVPPKGFVEMAEAPRWPAVERGFVGAVRPRDETDRACISHASEALRRYVSLRCLLW